MKIGITDRLLEVGSFEFELERKGAQFVFLNSLNERKFKDSDLAGLDALLVWHAQITELSARRLKNCKIVVRYGIGYDQVDVAALRRAGIRFANNPSYCTEEVADTACAMILNGVRGVTRHDNLARHYGDEWQEHNLATWRSSDRNVGLIGLGKIGVATALRLKAFGFNISAFDPYVDRGFWKSLGVNYAGTLDELLRSSDVVSLHCPLTEETVGMINAEFLACMKPDAILVNTGRGKLMQSLDTLAVHLRANRAFRVYLDVLPIEPPGDDRLIAAWRRNEDWLSGRLVVNPHNAYFSDQSHIEQRVDANETVRLALYDGIFRNTIN
ncbi:C-terminal binding protein [Variovorax sp. GrIS 2.14]|jgi:C-terminal binding protein|uniref:C-terminal binding protein n=1 Tax=unclassified Variovorax TaxID=663243 RepID=UPI002B23BC05|nr:C-terminal binding protein [Variovorax sp. RTB1]MEB0110907.1 C-terminal binding protein [Variovorax sp. RTB1]